MEKKKSGKKKALWVVLAVILALVVVVGVAASVMLEVFHPGNRKEYDVAKVETVPGSPLAGKRIVFLGSSVTAGLTSRGVSFVDYIEKMDNCHCVKEAVSGTTLVDNGPKSYVQRLVNKLDPGMQVDLFVCQLSTNDASKQLPLGEVSESYSLEDFDTSHVTGALEYIIAYAQATWNCPVMFYTGTYYDSPHYAAMVNILYKLQEKWGIGIIDQWNNPELNAIDDAARALYMKDPIHPTRAGYLHWWTPGIRKAIIEYIN